MAIVAHPDRGFTGRVNGVMFNDGRGEADSKAALLWFATHGFAVGSETPVEVTLHEGDQVLSAADLPDLLREQP